MAIMASQQRPCMVLAIMEVSECPVPYCLGPRRLHARTTPCTFRSNHSTLLKIPRVTGSRMLSFCTPHLRNVLPLSLRSQVSTPLFQKKLKTHIFGLSYPPQTCVIHAAPWLSTGNIKGLLDDGHGEASALKLGFTKETGTVDVLHIHSFTKH